LEKFERTNFIMSLNNIVELDDKNWEEIVEKGEKPVFVMFSSSVCPHCKQIKPFFDQYAVEYKDIVVFALIDVSKTPAIAIKYGVMGTPTFKFFCKGHPVAEVVGAIYPALLKKTVEDSIKHGHDCIKNTTWGIYDISGYA